MPFVSLASILNPTCLYRNKRSLLDAASTNLRANHLRNESSDTSLEDSAKSAQVPGAQTLKQARMGNPMKGTARRFSWRFLPIAVSAIAVATLVILVASGSRMGSNLLGPHYSNR